MSRGPPWDKGGWPESSGGPRSSLPAAAEVLGRPAGARWTWRDYALWSGGARCCWRRAKPLIVLGPACEHDTWPGRGTEAVNGHVAWS
ncbi:hypothetical protein NDU88_003460 [Pleurodeles waltl]|uniref:Uncharacterized protein n=1 Tax=Pleurodeles waltl TaxID=8319 RepID=A0AAV7VE78_PLEWA|nr:hypothetical protein NDU88_003460 [Pleurodeles waltl]